jgi:hypothetical protein
MLLASGFVAVALVMMVAGVSLAVCGLLVLRQASSSDPDVEDQSGCAYSLLGSTFIVVGALLIVMGILIFAFEPN